MGAQESKNKDYFCIIYLCLRLIPFPGPGCRLAIVWLQSNPQSIFDDYRNIPISSWAVSSFKFNIREERKLYPLPNDNLATKTTRLFSQ